MRWIATFAAAVGLSLATGVLPARCEPVWHGWDAAIFERAKAENKLVILDLEAVWCHWCHVMERETYSDARVAKLISDRFIAVRSDQDAHPDLASRYGDWGWPATILFASDGTELAKLRGYVPAERFAALLQAFVDDPTPGPSASKELPVVPAETGLAKPARDRIVAEFNASYDSKLGGWSDEQKFIEADSMDYALAHADADPRLRAMARQTLDAALALIDPVWGGIFQYSEGGVWTKPHYEKLMSFQAQHLRQYALAYGKWHDARYRAAADGIYRYLVTRLSAPDASFYTSQDADVSAAVAGAAFYGSTSAERDKLGQPRIDRNAYSRENGQAISALVAYYGMTGEQEALARAVAAARWVVANRSLAGGGYAHGERDRAGPYLGDTLAFGQAALDLYAATADRSWLQIAMAAGAFISAHFTADAGYFTSEIAESTADGFQRPYRQFDENVALGRFAVLLSRYSGRESDRAMAEHAMTLLASEAMLEAPRQQIGLVLFSEELATEPVHITVIGSKNDAAARALSSEALRIPELVKRVEWWDKSEGPLVNPDVTYPELEVAAAYACANRICSLPVTEPAELAEAVRRMAAKPNAGPAR